MDLIETKDNVNRHPWELSRTDCLLKEAKKYHNNGSILDIGPGDCFFDEKLLASDIKISQLSGIDIYLKNEVKNRNYYITNTYDSLKGKKFDTIIMFDVLEHIENDEEFLKSTVNNLLKKSGKVIMTVPAHQFLFSKHDQDLKHFRRYNKKMIKNLAQKSNYKIVKIHYFYFSLFIFRLLFRNTKNEVNSWTSKENSLKTNLLRKFLNIDYHTCKAFNKISTGLSIFVVLKKNN